MSLTLYYIFYNLILEAKNFTIGGDKMKILGVKEIEKILKSVVQIYGKYDTMKWYRRINDESDGTKKGHIEVALDRQGDVHFNTDDRSSPEMRFRLEEAGGRSPNVRVALMILLVAIDLDNKKDPRK